MRTLMADLTGLVIGFALGGAALVHFLPQIEQMRLPSIMAWVAGPSPQVGVVPAAPLPAVLGPPGLIRPSLMPRGLVPPQLVPPRLAPPEPEPAPDGTALMPSPAPLPQIIEPNDPSPAEPPPVRGSATAGTGFFVTDNLVMTAAHVVPECRGVEIVSPFVRRSPARVEARDTSHDIALLRVAGARAPATLAIGRPTAANARVFMLGYPLTAGLLVPEETWGIIENDKLPRDPGNDPREHVLLEASAVTHGYSGGPIFDPRSGKVVGILRAVLYPNALRAVRGMPNSGLAVGPGSALLDAFLQDEAPGTNAFPADQWGDDPLTVVRHATVHVLCWH